MENNRQWRLLDVCVHWCFDNVLDTLWELKSNLYLKMDTTVPGGIPFWSFLLWQAVFSLWSWSACHLCLWEVAPSRQTRLPGKSSCHQVELFVDQNKFPVTKVTNRFEWIWLYFNSNVIPNFWNILSRFHVRSHQIKAVWGDLRNPSKLLIIILQIYTSFLILPRQH